VSNERNIIARPYARALFEFALAKQQVQLWGKILQVMAIASSDPTLAGLITNPKVDNTKVAALLVELCKFTLPLSAEQQQCNENFIALLVDQQRLLVLPQMSQLYATLCAEHEKVLKATVTTCFALDLTRQQRLLESLQQRFKCKVELDYDVDESLLGGMIIRAGDHVIDGSARSKLLRLTDYLNLKERV
jgi:F-type H+-transporting ATPase subunit delta